MFVACDFDRVCEIADMLHKKGVEGAELQLVGWNRGGQERTFEGHTVPSMDFILI